MATKKPDRKSGNGRGSIDKLPSGMFRWRITVGQKTDGTPIRKSGAERTETAAHKAMTQALADHLRGGVAMPDRVTLGEWLTRWLASKQGHVAEKTYSNYGHLIELHIPDHLSRKRLQEIRPADLSNLYQNLKHTDIRRKAAGGTAIADFATRPACGLSPFPPAFADRIRLTSRCRERCRRADRPPSTPSPPSSRN